MSRNRGFQTGSRIHPPLRRGGGGISGTPRIRGECFRCRVLGIIDGYFNGIGTIPRVVGIEPCWEGEAPSEPAPLPAGSHGGSPSLPGTSLGRARLRPSLLRSPPARTEARPPFPERRLGGRGSVRAFSAPRRLARRLALPSRNVAWEGEAPSELSPLPAGSHGGSPSLPGTSLGRARLRPELSPLPAGSPCLPGTSLGRARLRPSFLRSPPARTEARPPFPERRFSPHAGYNSVHPVGNARRRIAGRSRLLQKTRIRRDFWRRRLRPPIPAFPMAWTGLGRLSIGFDRIAKRSRSLHDRDRHAWARPPLSEASRGSLCVLHPTVNHLKVKE